jgi:hypothetical protein
VLSVPAVLCASCPCLSCLGLDLYLCCCPGEAESALSGLTVRACGLEAIFLSYRCAQPLLFLLFLLSLLSLLCIVLCLGVGGPVSVRLCDYALFFVLGCSICCLTHQFDCPF